MSRLDALVVADSGTFSVSGSSPMHFAIEVHSATIQVVRNFLDNQGHKVLQTNTKSIRLNFAELCGTVRFKGEALLVIRRGKPTALFTAPNDPSPGIIH